MLFYTILKLVLVFLGRSHGCDNGKVAVKKSAGNESPEILQVMVAMAVSGQCRLTKVVDALGGTTYSAIVSKFVVVPRKPW